MTSPGGVGESVEARLEHYRYEITHMSTLLDGGEGSGLVIGLLYDVVVLSFTKAYHSNGGELGCTDIQK